MVRMVPSIIPSYVMSIPTDLNKSVFQLPIGIVKTVIDNDNVKYARIFA